MNLLLELFLTFLKIGLFTFGGGYAMISLIEDCCVERKKWITHDEMMDITVIAESTPGPIAINCATFVGYKRGGLPGALCATFGVVCPSFAVIFVISGFLDHFLEITVIAHAFQGIRIAVGLLILDAAITMIKNLIKNEKKRIMPVLIMIVSFLLMFLADIFAWNFSSIGLMFCAGFISLAVYAIKGVPGQKGGA